MAESNWPQAPKSPGSALKWILGLQVGIAAMLILSTLPDWWPRGGQTTTDLNDGPVSPGDQFRTYDPNRTPPNLPPVELTNAPTDQFSDRLEFDTIDHPDYGLILTVTGAIDEGDAGRFLQHLNEMPTPPDSVAFHSPGGLVMEALSIGKHIRDAELNTRMGAGSVCLSSCPYAFAGGVARVVDAQSMIGLHQHYYDTPRLLPVFLAVSNIQHGQAETMDHLVDMGVDPAVIRFGLRTPPDQIYALVADELLDSCFATEVLE